MAESNSPNRTNTNQSLIFQYLADNGIDPQDTETLESVLSIAAKDDGSLAEILQVPGVSSNVDAVARIVSDKARSLVDDLADQVGRLSRSEQRRLGLAMHKSIRSTYITHALRRFFLFTNPRVDRLYRLAKPFLECSKSPNGWFSFYLVQHEEENAFVHVGGYVYFTTGLLNGMASQDLALEFVVGHEIAHEELGHTAKSLAFSIRAGEKAGAALRDGSFAGWILGTIAEESASSLAGGIMSVVERGYSQEEEYAADAWSTQVLIRSGRSTAECCGLMRRMSEVTEESQSAGDVQTVISSYFNSHPHPVRRLQALVKVADQELAKSSGSSRRNSNIK